MDGIGIVGAGIAGLHLALFLQQHGVAATLYAETTADGQRAGPLRNTAVHWRTTRDRERLLGVNHWDDVTLPGGGAIFGDHCLRFCVAVPDGSLRVRGALAAPAISVDHRILTATLLEDFEDRGGTVVVGPVTADAVEGLTERHDLVVVSAGRDSLTGLFATMPEHCPYREPQRLVCTGVYDGIRYPDPLGVGFNIVPGVGELFELPFYTFDGPKTALLFEVVPGGPGEVLLSAGYDDDPDAFTANILGFLAGFMPDPWERTDPAVFGPCRGGVDVLQGAVTPVVRRPYTQLGNGRWVMAIGDLHATNDPLLGQGANAASHAAFAMGEAILAERLAYDEHFCARTAGRLWSHLGRVTAWNNLFLGVPPPTQLVQTLMAAAHNPAVADAFADAAADPEAAWDLFATPQRTRAWLRSHGCATPLLDQVLDG